MAFIVNGEKVEDSVIRKEVERLRPRYEEVFVDKDPKEREAQLLDWSKENVIERILLSQELKNSSDRIPTAEVESALARLKEQYTDQQELYEDFDVTDDEKLKEAVELQMRVERKINNLCKRLPEPSQAEIERYYEENKEQFKSDEQVRVAHIVRYVNWQTDEATAYQAIKKAHDELEDGAAFEVVVDKYTDCADSGGDLGYVARGQMVEEFEDVVFNLGVGEMSDVFRTRFGFHIAKVYDRKAGAMASLKEAEAEIVEQLTEQMREKAVDEFVDQLRSKAEIKEI
jgi:parvulin-like peptidyl-prolyl isomerase